MTPVAVFRAPSPLTSLTQLRAKYMENFNVQSVLAGLDKIDFSQIISLFADRGQCSSRVDLSKIQFGIWNPFRGNPLSFAVEKEYSAGNFSIYFHHHHKAIYINFKESHGDRDVMQNGDVIVRYPSIRGIIFGTNSEESYICLELCMPATIEIRTPRDGEQQRDGTNRDRVPALDEDHERIAQYAYTLRLVFAAREDVDAFQTLSKADCRPPVRQDDIPAQHVGLYSAEQLRSVRDWIRTMDWDSAFQIEALLRGGCVLPHELLHELRGPIYDMQQRFSGRTGDILRQFSVALHSPDRGTILQCFRRVCSEQSFAAMSDTALPHGNFSCCHVTITPTRMIPEGSIVTQSNRIIRRYQEEGVDATKHFIRVAFRDEDRRSYRWDREVDMTILFRRRVGAILKDGFELGGARFEFLAYSMSGLREHSVWFIRPFTLEGELITAEKIRRSIGNFAKTDLMKQPSKYAARLALAFTATSHYVTLTKGQWSEMPDLVGGDESQSAAANKVHTDGVGTISAELMALVAKDSSAVQVRILGYKGMLVRDDRLSGACVRLRPSMRKFAAHNADVANLEIVRTFERPNPAYLNRPLVMVLEDRGVDKQAFFELQEQAKRTVSSAEESLQGFLCLLQNHSLGFEYRLPFILKHCRKLATSLAPGLTKETIPDGFLRRLARYTAHSVLRDIKYRARIPVPHSYSLVGVADEGRAYIAEGLQSEDVFTLNEGQIAACIQDFPDADPVWLEGECIISRSPVVHPGDVQKVYAVGKPPDKQICFFKDLRNVVIFPAAEDRSLASCLGGGDLDGDMYDIIIDNPSLLHPLDDEEAADYDGVGTRTLGRECTVHDICDFVVEYINSDVLGLLSERHLTIADQSDKGTRDVDCKRLAKLCSQAVDYAKHGTAVDLVADPLPEPRRKGKPDWRRVDESDGRSSDYYESPRALGHLFRNIDLPKPEEFEQSVEDIPSSPGHLSDLVLPALAPIVTGQLLDYRNRSSDCEDIPTLFTRYTREMRYIRMSYTLQDGPDACLAEEEVVLGTILAWSSQTGWRTNRIADMNLQLDALVKGIRCQLLPRTRVASPEQWKEGLTKAWDAWGWCSDNAGKDGIDSFGLIALGAVLECLERLGALPA